MRAWGRRRVLSVPELCLKFKVCVKSSKGGGGGGRVIGDGI